MAPIVRALVVALVVPADQVEPLATTIDQTTTELVRKVAAMPRYMGLGIVVLTWVFEWWGLLHGGRRFRHLGAARQERQLRLWRRAPLGLMRDLVEFYEKMGTFVFWSYRERELQ